MELKRFLAVHLKTCNEAVRGDMGLDSQSYKRFVKQSEFKKYVHVHGFCDAGTRLLFKFRSGTHGLNEGLQLICTWAMSGGWLTEDGNEVGGACWRGWVGGVA